MSEIQTIPTLEELAERSGATAEFRTALGEFLRTRRANDRVRYNGGAPAVKVQRAIMQLLAARPELPVESVEVDGASGCSDFRGHLVAHAAGNEHRFRFVWDCAWKARQMGWKTFWGDPDQQRAAQEFGYQCFEVFEELG